MIELGLFIYIAGFIIGLGAVTVIDLHGFLGRKSSYWTEATIRTHKVTKPLIWIGIICVLCGSTVFFIYSGSIEYLKWQIAIAIALILNGAFLSFYISPKLIKREKEGKEKEILPKRMQYEITASFVVSFVGWWGSVLLLVCFLV